MWNFHIILSPLVSWPPPLHWKLLYGKDPFSFIWVSPSIAPGMQVLSKCWENCPCFPCLLQPLALLMLLLSWEGGTSLPSQGSKIPKITGVVVAELGLQAGFPSSCPGLFPELRAGNRVCLRVGMTAVQMT